MLVFFDIIHTFVVLELFNNQIILTTQTEFKVVINIIFNYEKNHCFTYNRRRDDLWNQHNHVCSGCRP
ncbi:MAG: hypothetical protein PWQ54_155 [Bacteroidales bacterium]|jgi:hypothetical protein|nr:hypothetical protein [Bacteroidales bacterium]